MSKTRPKEGEIFDIVSIPTINPKTRQKVINTYAISIVRQLGEGTFGILYEAELRDPDQKDAKPYGKVAIKLYKDPKSFRERELEQLNRFYFAQKKQKGDDIYLITQLLPGHDLQSDHYVVHPDLDRLTFEQRINLITQIVTQFNLLHHETAYKGAAAVHGDIKGGNIRVFIDLLTGRTEAYPVDFGAAKELKEEDPSQKTAATLEVNSIYFPPEIMSSQMGIKTDIYMLVAPILIILGEKNPYQDKIKATQEENKDSASKTRYHIDLTKVDFPDFLPGIDVRSLTTDFLTYAQNPMYEQRSDSDEMLRYFMTLNQLVQVHKKSPNDIDAKTILLAKLALISSGIWNEEIGTIKVDKLDKEGKIIGVESIPQTFTNFDFSTHPKTCKTILECNSENRLPFINIKDIINCEDEAITFEYNAKILQVRLQTLTDKLAKTPDTANARKLSQVVMDITQEFNLIIDAYTKTEKTNIDKMTELHQRLGDALDKALINEPAHESKSSFFDKSSNKELILAINEVKAGSPLVKKMEDAEVVAKIPLSPVHIKIPSPSPKSR